MNIQWKYLLKNASISGLLFCVAIMVGVRINVKMFAHDFPDIAEREIRALDIPDPTAYEWILLMVAVQGAILWLAFRFLSDLNVKDVKKSTFLYRYVHLVIWFWIVGICDLVLLDWLLIGLVKIPFAGVEHLLSQQAVEATQAYSFHFSEHFIFYGTYLANILIPLVLVAVFTAFSKGKGGYAHPL